MDGALRLFRISGIDVQVHSTWLIAFFLITFSLSRSVFPEAYPDWQPALYWFTGAMSAILLFVSVLLHELAHSFMAKARGLPVNGITLFIFGGVSSIPADAEEAGDEFAIAIVGPATSLVLAGAFWLLGGVLAGGAREPGPLLALVDYLTVINIALAVFNLVPGFPLDGGRVLRAFLWGIGHHYVQATVIATTVGQLVAFLLIGYGAVQIFSGNILGGLWMGLIGWFLNGAAETSRRDVVARQAFQSTYVRDLMDPQPLTVSPDTTVERFVRDHILGQGQRALPVCQGDRLVGIVSITDVKTLPEEQWPTTTVAEIMTSDPLFSVPPSAGIAQALQVIAAEGVHQLPVVENGRLVGLLTRAHILEHLQFREELGVRRAARPPRG